MDNVNRICFEKPDLDTLNQSAVVVDMHFHTVWSDGTSTVDEIADRARSLGIGVSITDHNEIKGAVEMDRHKDVMSIPGIELTSREGTHILVYFYTINDLKRFFHDDVMPYRGATVMSSLSITVEEIIQKAGMHKSLVIFPHPHSAAYTGICNQSYSVSELNRLMSLVDGVEVINSENLKRWNMKSALLGFNLDRSITGGSDGHTLGQLGAAVTYADCPKNAGVFLDAVKKKKARVVGKETQILRKIRSNSAKLKTSINHYPDIVEKNINYGRNVISLKSKRLTEKVWQVINDREFKKTLPVIAGLTFLKIHYNFLPFFIFSIS